jgi:diacylglycerol kinase family enzyme
MPAAAFIINRTLVHDPGPLRRHCCEAAEAAGWTPLLRETTLDDRGFGLAREAIAAGARLVFAVGGDGTVRACAQALAGTGVPLAIIASGTANLAARAIRLPSRRTAALAAGFNGNDRALDLAVADEMTYVAMAGMGLDAAVVAATPAARKRRLGWPAYAIAGVPRLAGRSHQFTIRLDGGEPMALRARSVVAGNAGLLPGGFVLLPDARLDDGMLDVGVLAPEGLIDWSRVALQVMAASRHGGHELQRFRAREVEIHADTELPREVDGEIIRPGRSLRITVLPGALIVRVPRAA